MSRHRSFHVAFVTLLHILLLTAVFLQGPVLHAQKASATTSAPINGAPSSVSSDTHDAVRQLIGETILNGRSYEYDGYLSDRIGPRLTGSANYVRATEWAEQQFRELGLTNVHKEEWTMPATWEPESPSIGCIVKPVEHKLHIYSVGWSPSTQKDGVKGEVVYVPSLASSALDAQKTKLLGAVALLDDSSFGEKPTMDKIMEGFQQLRSFSPAAILVPGGSNGSEVLFPLSLSGAIDPIPEAEIGVEDASLVRRLLERGPVVVQFSLANRIRKDVKVANVIAEIPGREPSSEVVIVGAHLDSWQAGTGAQDNGTGVASVLETARVIMAINQPPRHTIRFVLFGGEEQGLLGSTAYVRQHGADLSKIDAVLITDSGSQPAKGWYLMGREDEKEAVTAIKPLLTGLGADGVSSDTKFIFETDHAAFDVLGVPTLVLWNDVDKYSELHHKASDTFDSVVGKDLAQGTAVTAVTAYAIADRQKSFAPHLSATEVESMLRKAGVLDQYNYLKGIGTLP